MNVSKNFVKFAAVSVFLCFLTLSVSAQRTRSRRTTPRPKPEVVSTVGNLDIKSGAEKVSIQIKNMTKFLYFLGGISKGIEDIDKAIKEDANRSVRDRRTSREIADRNAKFKSDVIQSIRNLRAGLAALEVDFRTKPELKRFLFQIQGISDISGTAEDQALAGQFGESGKTLLFVVEKLADTLAAMPSR